jgi:hypothetical protein
MSRPGSQSVDDRCVLRPVRRLQALIARATGTGRTGALVRSTITLAHRETLEPSTAASARFIEETPRHRTR